jgi:NAD(P)-dependent dehydrogenase (short-subunit alcohol dehydrogenase family)
MEKSFSGKVAIVTGGGSGIGQSTAVLFASLGARVVVSDINEKGGAETIAIIEKNGGEALFVKADVSKPGDCENLVSETINTFGRLDIAFNNAGIGGESNPVADMSIEGWNRIISVNLSSVFYCMKYQIASMLKNGKGAIVNMSSILGSVGFANSAGYVAAKHGVIGVTQNAAIEYSARGIRVNAVGPGFINTPLLTTAGMDDNMKNFLAKMHPIGRLGESGEVAELVVWLCSDKASFVTGSYYPVDGGYLAQ